MVVAESANCCLAVFHWLRYVLGAPFWSIHSCGFIWPRSGVISWLPELTSASSFCAAQGSATPPAASTCVDGPAGMFRWFGLSRVLLVEIQSGGIGSDARSCAFIMRWKDGGCPVRAPVS